MKRVVIFCPNPYSLYTTSVTVCLQRQGIQIAAIVVRKFTLQRFKKEFARDGKRLLRKIVNKLFLREKAYGVRSFETIVSFRKAQNIDTKNVKEFKNSGTIIHYCNDLNDDSVAKLLQLLKVDLIIFTGGGIVRQQILQHAGAGIVNCHMGVLPPYRGMDVVEWPLLEGNYEQLGCTVHFMDNGIDTGDILYVQKIKLEKDTPDIKALREKYEPVMIRALVSTVIAYLHGDVTPIKQTVPEGKQYFKMHHKLITLANKKIAVSR